VAPLKQEDVSKVCVLHTISKAWSIGRAVERGQRAQQDPIDAILGSVPSKLIFKGKVRILKHNAAYYANCFISTQNDKYYSLIPQQYNYLNNCVRYS